MSQSLLYHAFGVKGVTYRSTRILGNALVFSVETTNRHVACQACGHRYCLFKGQDFRWFRMSPIGRNQALLQVIMHRLQCAQCRCLWWPRLPFAKGNARYTRSFALSVLDLLQFGTIRAVAEYLRVSWDLVKEIHKTRLAVKYRTINLSEVRYLGIDEFSLKKRHTYMTIFVDLQSGRILHAVEGTSKEALAPFLRTVAKKAKKLRAVAMDMSTSYTSAVREHLPDVPIVFDRYHVMALINRQNALVNDQLGRFRLLFGSPAVREWFESTAGRPAKFARYTGRTLYPGRRKENTAQHHKRLEGLQFYLELERDSSNGDNEARDLIRELENRGKWPAKPSSIPGAQNGLSTWFGSGRWCVHFQLRRNTRRSLPRSRYRHKVATISSLSKPSTIGCCPSQNICISSSIRSRIDKTPTAAIQP